MPYLSKAMSPEVAIQTRYKDAFMVNVSSMGAELEQIRQKLGLVNCDDTEAAVVGSQRVPQLCQARCGVAGLQKQCETSLSLPTPQSHPATAEPMS